MRITILLLLFFTFAAWFLSRYKSPAIRLLSATLLIAGGYAAEARFASLMYSGGETSLLIADFLVTIILFSLGIWEFKKYFDFLWFNRRRKQK